MNDQLNSLEVSGDIDPLFLTRLQELGGPKLASELVGMYLIRGVQLLDTISNGIEKKDITIIKNAAHSLISSAGNLGGKKVSELAKHIENAAIDNQLDDIPNLLSNLISAHDDFQAYLNGVLEQL